MLPPGAGPPWNCAYVPAVSLTTVPALAWVSRPVQKFSESWLQMLDAPAWQAQPLSPVIKNAASPHCHACWPVLGSLHLGCCPTALCGGGGGLVDEPCSSNFAMVTVGATQQMA